MIRAWTSQIEGTLASVVLRVDRLDTEMHATARRLDARMDALTVEVRAGFERSYRETSAAFGDMRQWVASEALGIRANMRRGFRLVDRRFGQVEGRLTALESRVTAVEDRLTAVEGRLTVIEGRLDGMDTRFDRIEGQLNGMTARFDQLEALIRGLEASIRAR